MLLCVTAAFIYKMYGLLAVPCALASLNGYKLYP
jgi:hypothetical protein